MKEEEEFKEHFSQNVSFKKMRICHIGVVKDISFLSKSQMDYTMKFYILMASKMKYFSVIISLLIKHAYGLFPMNWIYFQIQIIENILCMLQMFISHINRIKSKLLIKTEKDKSNLILRDWRNVKNFVRIFVPFFSILFPILFRMIFERTLTFQFETRISRICGFNNTVGYTVFVSLNVRKFEFFPIIWSGLEPHSKSRQHTF